MKVWEHFKVESNFILSVKEMKKLVLSQVASYIFFSHLPSFVRKIEKKRIPDLIFVAIFCDPVCGKLKTLKILQSTK